MVQSKKLIAGLGVVAGLGVAMLPLGAFAATTGEQTIKAVVEESLSLTVSSNIQTNQVSLTRGGDANNTLIHTLRVEGNTYNDYRLTMNAKTADDANLRLIKDNSKDRNTDGASARYDANNTIDSIAEATDTIGTDGGWGYKSMHQAAGEGIEEYSAIANPAAANFSGNWNPIPTPDATGVIKAKGNVRTASYDEYHYVNFGIKAASDQVAGTYEAVIEYNVTTAD
ncbi:hypothetical protein IKE71_00985 [Candidatus Saccharibacteria bacterium]|nr:hypothetical protein [Candidatus Saccharibacteria bacterium]